MVTMKDASKGLECPKFSDKEGDYQVWVTKFVAYSKVNGFYKIMDGTEVPVPMVCHLLARPQLVILTNPLSN